MKTSRVIDTSFWTDKKISERMTPRERYFMLYLLTNPHTTQLGIYQISPRQIEFESGINESETKELFEKFEKEYNILKVSDAGEEIAIRNYLKYNISHGGKPTFDLLRKESWSVSDQTLFEYIYPTIKTTANKTVKDFGKWLVEEGLASG